MTKAQRERAERLIAEPGVLGAARETCEARKAVRETMRKVLAEVGRMVREGGLAESDAPAMLWRIEREARAREAWRCPICDVVWRIADDEMLEGCPTCGGRLSR